MAFWDDKKDTQLIGLVWDGLIAEGIAPIMGLKSPSVVSSRLRNIGTSMSLIRKGKREGQTAEQIHEGIILARQPKPPVQQELPLAKGDVIALLGIVIDSLQQLTAKIDRIDDALNGGLAA